VIDLAPRAVPGTDLRIGRAVLGTMTFGDQVDADQAEQLVHRARDLGVTMFDTANVYNDGCSEQILGRILAPFRDEVQIATKVGVPPSSAAPDAPRLDRGSVRRECEASLRRLGVDHVDLYYLHTPDPRTPMPETLAACAELVAEGKVRHLAISNHAAWQITDAVHLADANGWPRVRASQPMYNLLARRIEDEYAACSQHLQLADLVYNPLAGGLLTGKHRFDAAPAEGTRFDRRRQYRDRYWNEDQFTAVERLSAIAADAGVTLVELAVRWLLSRPLVDGVIFGVSSLEHLESNLAAAHGPAPDADTCARIDEVWDLLRGAAPRYNR
jgi:aryl-alcohol dehydrogenase-like predicted oxidoreductase